MMPRVFVGVVTYGDRYKYLRKNIEQLLKSDVEKIVIICNNVSEQSLKSISELSSKFSKIIHIENKENNGSAIGFAMAIQHALISGCEFLWLLDDDILLQPDTLKILIENWHKLLHTMPQDNFALCCFRKEHHPDLLAGRPIKSCYLRKGSFLGRHFINVLYRLRNITPWRSKPRKKLPDIIEIPYTSYGGFFAHSSVYKRIGLPKAEFCLYYDDNEYTIRLTRNGGKIFLCPHARLDSLENSWFKSETRMRFGLEGWLKMTDDFRVYYGVRNLVYFEMYYYPRKIIRFFNRIICLIILGLWSIFTRKKERFKLIIRAVQDGEHGRLGYNKMFPLP
ncbi:MAG: glycosyltransferase [Bacteroidales bacterium]